MIVKLEKKDSEFLLDLLCAWYSQMEEALEPARSFRLRHIINEFSIARTGFPLFVGENLASFYTLED